MACWSFWSWCEGARAILQLDHLHWHQGARTARALGKGFFKGQQRTGWLIDSGTMRVVPVRANPVEAFRAQGEGGASERLLASCKQDLAKE